MAINPMITHGETFGRIVATEKESVIMGPRNSSSNVETDGASVINVRFHISRHSGSAYRAVSARVDKCEAT